METKQISGEKLRQVRGFIVEVLRTSKQRGDPSTINDAALSLFTKYKGIFPLAIKYEQNWDGNCPIAKRRAKSAVNEFYNIQNLVENLLSGSKSGELSPGDFLPVDPVSGRPAVRLC